MDGAWAGETQDGINIFCLVAHYGNRRKSVEGSNLMGYRSYKIFFLHYLKRI
jgi:hypothetical protein